MNRANWATNKVAKMHHSPGSWLKVFAESNQRCREAIPKISYIFIQFKRTLRCELVQHGDSVTGYNVYCTQENSKPYDLD